MDEKIEEMIKDIKKMQPFFYGNIAEMFIAKGYRKESDTAREILTELLKIYIRREDNNDTSYAEDESITMNDLFDLAEKYGVDLGE